MHFSVAACAVCAISTLRQLQSPLPPQLHRNQARNHLRLIFRCMVRVKQAPSLSGSAYTPTSETVVFSLCCENVIYWHCMFVSCLCMERSAAHINYFWFFGFFGWASRGQLRCRRRRRRHCNNSIAGCAEESGSGVTDALLREHKKKTMRLTKVAIASAK